MIAFHLQENGILPDRSLLVYNEGAVGDVEWRLPKPFDFLSVEVLQLAKHRIILNTNSDEIYFTVSPPARKLIVAGTSKAFGRSLTLQTWRGEWRILQSTFTEAQLTFEE